MEKKTDLRILKTHKALCDTFLQMLSEKRFEDITVNELCDRAMIRRATFYKHFADKYDFFAFFIRQTEESFITADKDYQNHKSSYEYLLFLFRECINFFKEHDRLVESILKSNMLSTMVDIFSEEIYRNVLLYFKELTKENNTYSVRPEILATFYSGGIIQILRLWLLNPDFITEKELISEVEKLFLHFNL